MHHHITQPHHVILEKRLRLSFLSCKIKVKRVYNMWIYSLNKYLLNFYCVPGPSAYILVHNCVSYSKQNKHLWAPELTHLLVGSSED